MATVDKHLQILTDGKLLLSIALLGLKQSKLRALSKVQNPVIRREMDLEIAKVEDLMRAVNSL